MTTPFLIQTGVFAPMHSHHSEGARGGGGARHDRLRSALPWLWLGLSAVWAVVIFTTDQVAWPLALWVATTLGPLAVLSTRLERDSQGGNQ